MLCLEIINSPTGQNLHSTPPSRHHEPHKKTALPYSCSSLLSSFLVYLFLLFLSPSQLEHRHTVKHTHTHARAVLYLRLTLARLIFTLPGFALTNRNRKWLHRRQVPCAACSRESHKHDDDDDGIVSIVSGRLVNTSTYPCRGN